MDLEKYQELTGLTVDSSDEASVTAQINRTRVMLETMLGYPLCSDTQYNYYQELGKTQLECACPEVDVDNLDDPDDVEGAYRLFSYNEKDESFHVDPFVALYKVKLVFIRAGELGDDTGVTLKTFDANEIRINMARGTWSKYIQHCMDCFNWCQCSCSDCVQLAVDADWLSAPPKDLLYVWADMVTYQTNCKKDVKSESIQGHSYTKFDRILPENDPQNAAIIQRYAGPHGSATSVVTV